MFPLHSLFQHDRNLSAQMKKQKEDEKVWAEEEEKQRRILSEKEDQNGQTDAGVTSIDETARWVPFDFV